jgi:sodium/proline symporter
MIVFASFCVFLALFVGVGVLSARDKQDTTEDYLVAGRSVSPWLTGLSAVASNNSGYMFVGVVGFTYLKGLEAFWITFLWVLGDYFSWFWFHRRLRAQSEEVGATSAPTMLGAPTPESRDRLVIALGGIATLVLLGLYAAAQLKAGSAATAALFGWPNWLGAGVGAAVVVVYCFSGGIRASIWTDAAQSIVMIFSMTMLVGYAMVEVGGPGDLMTALAAIENPDPANWSATEIDFGTALTDWFPSGLAFGFGAYVVGFLFAGIGTIGQPHILIRFMAIDSVDSVDKARTIYFVWYTLFSMLALAVGLYSRVLLPDLALGLFEPDLTAAAETALPALSQHLLPSVFVGVMLAGLFAATMSTADSQVLSCSAAITQDIFPRFGKSYVASKVATIGVVSVALLAALFAESGVFSLVLVAWSGLGAIFVPILFVRLARLPLPTALAVAMMASGIGTVVWWGSTPWSDHVFKGMPGILVPLALYALAWGAFLRSSEPSPSSS